MDKTRRRLVRNGSRSSVFMPPNEPNSPSHHAKTSNHHYCRMVRYAIFGLDIHQKLYQPSSCTLGIRFQRLSREGSRLQILCHQRSPMPAPLTCTNPGLPCNALTSTHHSQHFIARLLQYHRYTSSYDLVLPIHAFLLCRERVPLLSMLVLHISY